MSYLKRQFSELPQVVSGQLALPGKVHYHLYHSTNVVISMPVEMSQWHGGHLSVLVVVLELQLEHVLLDLRVPEWLQDSPAVCAKEVVAHVRVEVEEVQVVDKVPFLGSVLELLVIVIDDAHAVRLAVSQVAG